MATTPRRTDRHHDETGLWRQQCGNSLKSALRQPPDTTADNAKPQAPQQLLWTQQRSQMVPTVPKYVPACREGRF
jgi:hypothetical protein